MSDILQRIVNKEIAKLDAGEISELSDQTMEDYLAVTMLCLGRVWCVSPCGSSACAPVFVIWKEEDKLRPRVVQLKAGAQNN